MRLTRTSLYTILAPCDPTPREAFAAAELSRYLEAILGTAPSADAPLRFVVGGPGRNPAAAALIPKADFDALVTGEEGYLIRIGEDAVLFSARSHAALLRGCELLAGAREALLSGYAIDAALTDLEGALAAFAETDGRGVGEDIVAGIFGKFCVGK